MMGSNCVSMKILWGVLLFCFLLMGDTAATDIFCIPLVIVDMKDDDALLVVTVAVSVAVGVVATSSDLGDASVVDDDMVACGRYMSTGSCETPNTTLPVMIAFDSSASRVLL